MLNFSKSLILVENSLGRGDQEKVHNELKFLNENSEQENLSDKDAIIIRYVKLLIKFELEQDLSIRNDLLLILKEIAAVKDLYLAYNAKLLYTKILVMLNETHNIKPFLIDLQKNLFKIERRFPFRLEYVESNLIFLQALYYYRLNKLDDALIEFQQCLNKKKRLHHTKDEGINLYYIGKLCLKTNQIEQANSKLEMALEIFDNLSIKNLIIITLNELIKVYSDDKIKRDNSKYEIYKNRLLQLQSEQKESLPLDLSNTEIDTSNKKELIEIRKKLAITLNKNKLLEEKLKRDQTNYENNKIKDQERIQQLTDEVNLLRKKLKVPVEQFKIDNLNDNLSGKNLNDSKFNSEKLSTSQKLTDINDLEEQVKKISSLEKINENLNSEIKIKNIKLKEDDDLIKKIKDQFTQQKLELQTLKHESETREKNFKEYEEDSRNLINSFKKEIEALHQKIDVLNGIIKEHENSSNSQELNSESQTDTNSLKNNSQIMINTEELLNSDKLAESILKIIEGKGQIKLRKLAMMLSINLDTCKNTISKFEKLKKIELEGDMDEDPLIKVIKH